MSFGGLLLLRSEAKEVHQHEVNRRLPGQHIKLLRAPLMLYSTALDLGHISAIFILCQVV